MAFIRIKDPLLQQETSNKKRRIEEENKKKKQEQSEQQERTNLVRRALTGESAFTKDLKSMAKPSYSYNPITKNWGISGTQKPTTKEQKESIDTFNKPKKVAEDIGDSILNSAPAKTIGNIAGKAGMGLLDILGRGGNAVRLGLRELSGDGQIESINKVKPQQKLSVNTPLFNKDLYTVTYKPKNVFGEMRKGLSGEKQYSTDDMLKEMWEGKDNALWEKATGVKRTLPQGTWEQNKRDNPDLTGTLDLTTSVLSDPLTYTPIGLGPAKTLFAKGAEALLPKIAPKLAEKGSKYILSKATKGMLEQDLLKQFIKDNPKATVDDVARYADNLANNARDIVNSRNIAEVKNFVSDPVKSFLRNTPQSVAENANKALPALTQSAKEISESVPEQAGKTISSEAQVVKELPNNKIVLKKQSAKGNLKATISEQQPRSLKVKEQPRYNLPDNEAELTKIVDNMTKQRAKGIKIDLQLFAAAQKKLESLRTSKFYTNTIQRSKDIPDHIKAEMTPEEFAYAEQKVSEWDRIAEENVKRNRARVEQEIREAESIDGGVRGHESAKILKTYIEEGNVNKVKDWLKTIASKSRETARGLKSIDSAFAKNSKEYHLLKAQKVVDNFEDAIKKSNPKIAEGIKEDSKRAKEATDLIKNETNKVIDEVVRTVKKPSIASGRATSFPEMLQNKISKAINPKTKDESGFIRQMINDLFGEAKDNMKLPKIKKTDQSLQTLTNAYKFRNYASEIRSKAKELLKEEFKDSPQALKILDDYFNKGFKPPHSQKVFNDVLNKRLGGLNIGNKITTSSNKPNLADWIKDWHATGRSARENFVDSIMKETGLTGDEANSLKNLLDSRLHEATKGMKDKLLETVMKPTKKGIVKKATTKMTELTNIGLLENKNFTNRISEKMSPVIKQLMKEHNIKIDDVVKLSLKNRQAAKATLLRDVFRNAKVDDEEIVKLLKIVNEEFNSLSNAKRNQLLNNMLKPKNVSSKSMVDKLVEKINIGVYGDDVNMAIQDAIKQKYNLPTLTNDDVKFITETMDSVKDLDVGSEKYLESMAKVEKLILEKTPASLSQKVGTGAMINMLGNFTSNAANIGGNILLATPEIGTNPLRRALDLGISKTFKTGVRTAGKTEFGELAKGVKQGVRGVKRDMLGGKDFKDIKSFKDLTDSLANPINTNTIDGRAELGRRLAFENKPARIAENAVSSALSFGDRPFEQAYYNDALKQIMKVNKVNVVTDEMKQVARQIAETRTYKDKNMLSDAVLGIRNLPKKYLDSTGKTGLKKLATEIPQIVSQSEIPFAKTPTNIVKRALEYSPVGIVEGIAKLAANKGGMSMAKQREIVDILTRGITGTGMIGVGAVGGATGLITGSKADNATANKLQKQSGFQPNALKIGNTYIDLKKFQPLTTPLLAGASLSKGGVGEAGKNYTEGIGSAINAYTEMNMLQSIAKAAELFNPTSNKDKSKIMVDIAMTLPKQYVPSMLKKINYATDPYERNTDSKNLGQYALNQIGKSIPGISEQYPPNVDYKGDPIKNYSGNNNWANVMLNPYKITQQNNDPVLNESLRLYNAIGNSEVVLPDAKNTNTLGGIKLDTKQKNQYQKYLGNRITYWANMLLNNPDYKMLDNNLKATLFAKAIDLGREEAKGDMLEFLKVDTDKLSEDQKEKTGKNKELYSSFNLQAAN